MDQIQYLRHKMRERHQNTKSWRKTGEEYGLSGALARWFANGGMPGPKTRRALGLSPWAVAVVYVVTGEEVPPGAQVYSYSVCACGQPYISNHPARKRCFICSPYRKGRA